MSIFMSLLFIVHVALCIVLVLVVLMQRPRSEGLGAAFGGGVTDNIFGAQTTHVLAKFTTWLAMGFFAITLLLSVLTARASSAKTEVQKQLLSAPVPTATAEPSPSAAAAPVVPAVAPQGTPVENAPASN
jgi:preprotein translocase subunit SecG